MGESHESLKIITRFVLLASAHLLQHKVKLCLSLVHLVSFQQAEVGPTQQVVWVIHDQFVCCCVEQGGLMKEGRGGERRGEERRGEERRGEEEEGERRTNIL